MIAKLAAACVVLLASGGAMAWGACVVDIGGDEPVLEIEVTQPGRLAWHPTTMPGYRGLLLRPINRGGLYEIDGTNYVEIPGPAPGMNAHTDPPYLVRGGWRIHLGTVGGIVWGMPPGAEEWQRIGPGPRSRGAYDEGSRELYVSFGRGGRVLRWTGARFAPTEPFPRLTRAGHFDLSTTVIPLAIRTVDQAGGTFVVTQTGDSPRALWFRPEGGSWAQVLDGPALEERNSGLRLPGALNDVDVTSDGTAMRIFGRLPGEATLLLKRQGENWSVADAAPVNYWVLHRPSGARLGWTGSRLQKLIEKRFFFLRWSLEPVPLLLNILPPGEIRPEPIPDIAPAFAFSDGPDPESVSYFGTIKALEGIAPLLVQSREGWLAFDGAGFTALPSLRADRIGKITRIQRVGPLIVVQSNAGVFLLDGDLTARRVDSFPVEEPGITAAEIAYIEGSRTFVVVARGQGQIYVSSDFARFEQVPTPVRIRRIVAPLPDRPALLLVGADGLYALEGRCPESER